MIDITTRIRRKLNQLGIVDDRLTRIQEALGRIEARQIATQVNEALVAQEFRAFSQWGEDGIIQHLVRQLNLPRSIFVEFGVETYVESNTRFLLVNDNWSGLVIDGSESNIQFIRNDPIYWRHNLKADCSFITAENINQIISRNGISGEIGILSVDIDGTDYWVWKSIQVIDPVIVIVEYNARFGSSLAVTVPYDPGFVRGTAHHSMIYYGASLAAFYNLGIAKGYVLVGCNSAGNNAFFVRKDKLPVGMPTFTPEQAYVRNQFRESRGVSGELTFVDPKEEPALLRDLPLVTVE